MVMDLSKGEDTFVYQTVRFMGTLFTETHSVVEVESEKKNRCNFVVGAVNTN